jgi:hypothetical protein
VRVPAKPKLLGSDLASQAGWALTVPAPAVDCRAASNRPTSSWQKAGNGGSDDGQRCPDSAAAAAAAAGEAAALASAAGELSREARLARAVVLALFITDGD